MEFGETKGREGGVDLGNEGGPVGDAREEVAGEDEIEGVRVRPRRFNVVYFKAEVSESPGFLSVVCLLVSMLMRGRGRGLPFGLDGA